MISLTYQNYVRLMAEKAKLEEQISECRDQLKSAIPANHSADGVFHKVVARKNTKWAEACKRVIDLLVAETKRQKAWDMVEQLTKYDEVHTFEPARDTVMTSNQSEVG